MSRKSKKQKKKFSIINVIILSVIVLCLSGSLIYFLVPFKYQLYYGRIILLHLRPGLYYLKYIQDALKDRGYYFVTGIISLLFYLILIAPGFLLLSRRIFKKDYHPVKSDIIMALIYFAACVISFTLIIFSLSGVYNNFIKFEHRSYIFIDILYFITSCITGNNNDIVPETASAKLCLILINLLIYVHMTFTGIIIFKIIDKRE